MSYDKLIWKSGKTKLSAKNFNHMEDGISNADINASSALNQLPLKQDKLTAGNNITIIDNVISAVSQTAPVQSVNGQTGNVVLKTADLENNSGFITADYHDASKQDTLVSGTTIKTINGNSVLGSGNIEIQGGGSSTIPYVEYDAKSLNELTEAGVYKITTATDYPTGTSATGLLEVKKLSDNKCEQEWWSATNHAVRVFDNTTAGLHFYVNGVEKSQGTVSLTSGGTYTLEGDLLGNVEIGTGATSVNNRTKIILRGVNIQTTSQYAAINYKDQTSKLVIEVADNSENYLYVTKNEEKGDNDLGVIHSENNLLIQGVGYLTIKNNKGHGIKASELIINGDPHIYLDTKHDAVHGGKLLKITGGHFKVVNANDAFSSSEGYDETLAENAGKMQIYGGEFIIDKCAQAAFEGKSNGTTGLKKILNAKITLGTEVAQTFVSPNGFKIYNGLNEIINNSSKAIPTFTELAADFGTASIVDEDGNTYDCSPVEIELTPTADIVYTLQGNFSGHRIVIRPAANKKVDINVKNVYYVDETDDSNAFIDHQSTTKRLKLKFNVENSLSYISKKNGYAFKSAKNIQFTSKGDLVIACENGYGVYAKDGYCLLSGDGIRKIQKSKYGIYATSIRLGEDPEDIDDNKYGIADDAIYVTNNTDYDIKISANTSASPVLYGTQVIATQYHAGISMLGKVLADTGVSAQIIAQKGQVKNNDTTVLPYENTALCYVTETALTKNENVVTYTTISGFKETIPTLDPSSGSSWKVYAIPDNYYTKEEVDLNFVKRTEFNAVVAELNKLTPKNVTFSEITGVEGINQVKVYRVATSTTLDDQPVTLDVGESTKARDGDFGDILSNGEGQVNFKLVIPEGRKVAISSFEATPADGYKNFKTPADTGHTGLYRFTKVTKDFTVKLNVAETYDVEYITGQYPFDSNPTEVAKGAILEFKIAHNIGTAPTEEVARSYIATITSAGTDVLSYLTITNLGKNKVTYQLPAECISGKVIVTGKQGE